MSGDENAVTDTLPGGRMGDRLRAAREAQGLTLEQIAGTTRIPMRHLQTIERGGYDGLPALTYSTGFIKTWARQLGLDGQECAEAFRTELGMQPGPRTQPLAYEPADPRRTPPAGLALVALLLALVIGIGYLYWRGTAEDPAAIATVSPPPATAQASSPQPAGAPQTATPAIAQASLLPATGPVAIGATQDVWIKVSDGGKTLFMNVLHPGERFDVPADAQAPLLTTGRPGNTAITVGQTAIPPVGDPDRAAKDISLKPADLLARVTGAAAAPTATAPTPVPANPNGA